MDVDVDDDTLLAELVDDELLVELDTIDLGSSVLDKLAEVAGRARGRPTEDGHAGARLGTGLDGGADSSRHTAKADSAGNGNGIGGFVGPVTAIDMDIDMDELGRGTG